MKNAFKIFLHLIFFAFVSTRSSAQYIPIPLDTNHKWLERISSYFGPNPNDMSVCYRYYKVVKDSVINNTIYKFITSVGGAGPCNGYPALFRQDNSLRRVNIRIGNTEHILYNFNKNVGDTALLYSVMNYTNSPQVFTITAKDSVLLSDNIYHRRFNVGAYSTVIEGVGSTQGLTTPYGITFETGADLLCFQKTFPHNSTIYNFPYYSNCNMPIIASVNEQNYSATDIYPNPASDKIFLSGFIFSQAEIFDSRGRLCKNWINENSPDNKLDVSDLKEGIYLLCLKSNKSLIIQKKIVVAR